MIVTITIQVKTKSEANTMLKQALETIESAINDESITTCQTLKLDQYTRAGEIVIQRERTDKK
jgi:hypothetical protein